MVNNQKILFKFIQIHSNLNWHHISEYQTLSENFIREFQNKVNWIIISKNQKLSENFKKEFKHKLNGR